MSRWLPGADEAASRPLPRPDEAFHAEHAPEGEDASYAVEPALPNAPLPIALRICAAHLRAAQPELLRSPVEIRVGALSRIARSWLDRDDPLRREALAVLPDECELSPESVAWGLDRAFEVINERALGGWWQREGAPSQKTLSAHTWAGNVFVAGLPPVIASLLAGVPALIKAPIDRPSFAALFARSVMYNGPELGPCVGAAAWSRRDQRASAALLEDADLLFAFGDDESVGALRKAAPCDVHGFGDRYSVAALQADASVDDALLRALAIDHLAWDGAGCLSPRWIFVEGDAAAAEVLARRAAALLPVLAAELPGRSLLAGPGARRASWLADVAFSGWARSGPGWASAALPLLHTLPAAPPPRSLTFAPITTLERIPELLQPLGRRLQGLAYAGDPAAGALLEQRLRGFGLSYRCVPGQLQRPPVHWNHDDVRILSACC